MNVLPGDAVETRTSTVKLGPGLLKLPDPGAPVIATRAGTLHSETKKGRYWVDCNARRYVPAAQETVVGVVTHKSGEGYRVDIGSAHAATLDGLAFEGASKRNRPLLKVGAVVYARVSAAPRDMEPELECFNAQTRRADGLGELKGGFVARCGLALARRLLDPAHFLLPLVGARFALECAVGANGRVWLRAGEVPQTIALARCITLLDDEPDAGPARVRAFLDSQDI